MTKQQSCPTCGVAVQPSERYPNYLCQSCALEAVDEHGRSLRFHNTSIGGGFVAIVVATGERTTDGRCWVRGRACHADEAYFGGIVVRPL